MSRKKPLIAAVAVLALISLVAGAADAKRGGRPKPKPRRTTTTTVVATTTATGVTSSTTAGDTSTTVASSSAGAGSNTTTNSLIDVAHSGQRLGNHPKHSRSFKLAVNETLVATTIGISLDALRTELRTGLSITQAAAARGVSATTITGVLTTDMTAQINAALADGKLTQARATQLLGDLPITIANYINRVHYVRPLPTTTTTASPTTTAAPTTTSPTTTVAPTTTIVSG